MDVEFSQERNALFLVKGGLLKYFESTIQKFTSKFVTSKFTLILLYLQILSFIIAIVNFIKKLSISCILISSYIISVFDKISFLFEFIIILKRE